MIKKLLGTISCVVIMLCTIISMIYAITLAFVGGNIAMGIIMVIMFMAYLIWLLAVFL